MNTKFKDVAHLYLGCDCLIDNQIRKLDTVAHAIGSYEVYCSFCGMGYECSDIKPILRPLNDMTVEEELEYRDVCNKAYEFAKYKVGDNIGWSDPRVSGAIETQWLLSNHFDIFGLIESGEAIDKTKL